MKTIEERADDYVGHPEEIDEFSSATIKRQAFIDGAREQRGIDKAIFEKWYCKNICYRRKECQIPLNICFRIGEIEKQLEEEI